MSIATKTGDDGTTALMFGRRVPKTDLRVRAYGACDELSAAMGVARAFCGEPSIAGAILDIQKELIALMGELAVAGEDRATYAEKGFGFVEEPMVDRLGERIAEIEKSQTAGFTGWAVPGENKPAAFLDVARTVCRRAEREVVAMAEAGLGVNPHVIRYLNRLSDLCWLYARAVERVRD